MDRKSTVLLGGALVLGGTSLFASSLGLVGDDVSRIAISVLAAVVLVHLMLTVDPAWILAAGLISTMLAGHWGDVGLGDAVAPHRVLVAGGLVAVLMRMPPAKDRPALHFGRAHFALLAALAYLIGSAIMSGTLGISASQFAIFDQFGILPFALFVAAPVTFVTERQRNILLAGLVAAGAYLAITAVLEELELYSLVFPDYIGDRYVGTHFGRSRGPFVEAAANGLAIVVCAAAAGVAVMRWRRPLFRVLAAATLLMAPLALLLTVTRAAWLAGVAGGLVAFAAAPGLRRYLAPAAVAGTVMVVAAFAFIPGLAQEAQGRADDTAPVNERRNTNAAGLRMVADRPVLGFGWWFEDAALEPYFETAPDIPLTGASAGIHNVYLTYGVGLGLVGLALWLVAVGLAFGESLAVRCSPALAPWQAGLWAVVPAWLVIGLFGPAGYSFTTAVVWTWAGLLRTQKPAPPVLAGGPAA